MKSFTKIIFECNKCGNSIPCTFILYDKGDINNIYKYYLDLVKDFVCPISGCSVQWKLTWKETV